MHLSDLCRNDSDLLGYSFAQIPFVMDINNYCFSHNDIRNLRRNNVHPYTKERFLDTFTVGFKPLSYIKQLTHPQRSSIEVREKCGDEFDEFVLIDENGNCYDYETVRELDISGDKRFLISTRETIAELFDESLIVEDTEEEQEQEQRVNYIVELSTILNYIEPEQIERINNFRKLRYFINKYMGLAYYLTEEEKRNLRIASTMQIVASHLLNIYNRLGDEEKNLFKVQIGESIHTSLTQIDESVDRNGHTQVVELLLDRGDYNEEFILQVREMLLRSNISDW